MTDPDLTDQLRRKRLEEINQVPGSREALEARHGQVWSTDELAREFEATCFLAPYVAVKRRSDNVVGSMEFQHHPRFYFNFEVD